MMRVLSIAFPVAAITALAGCGASPFDVQAPRHPPQIGPEAPWRLTPVSHNMSEQEPPTERTPLALPDNASVDDYVQLALQRNPGIRAARQRAAQLGRRIPQVTSLDDPMFQVTPIGEMAQTAAGQVGLMTGISQKLPLPDKLSTRGRIAAQDVAASVQDLNQTQLAVIADTRRAYWSYYFATQGIRITNANRQLLDSLRQIAESQFRAGIVSQQDVLRASVELSNLDNELLTLHQRSTSAAAMLNSLIDRPVDARLPEPAPIELADIVMDEQQLDQLLAQAAESNPAIQRIREQIQGFRERLKLARLNRWPDLTVSANYVAVDDDGLSAIANGKDQWWIGFGVNLPIWSGKLDAAEDEARRGIFAGLAGLADTQNRVAFRVQDALGKVQTNHRQAALFRDTIVPQARQTLDASLAEYRANNVDFLTLVDNWRKLLDFQLMYQRSLSQLQQDMAELEKVLGRELEELNAPIVPKAEDETTANHSNRRKTS